MPYYVRLVWQDNSDNEDNFVVYRQRDGNDNLQPHAYVAAGIEEYIEVLSGGYTYYYEVRAVNSAGESDPTNQISITTILSAPTLTADSPADDTVQLTWNDPNDVETEYRVFRRLTGETSWALIATLDEDSTGYVDSGLLPLTSYDYVVTARNESDGQYVDSNTVTQVTINGIPNFPRLDQATELAWENIYLSWTDQSTNEDYFQLFRRADGGAWLLIYQGTSTGFYDDFTTGGPRLGSVLYEYHVSAVNEVGNADSNILAITDSDGVLPAPTDLVASNIQTDSIDITWTDNSSSGGPGGNESNFLIEYINQTTGTISTWSRPADTVSETIPGLNDDTVYSIRVGAHNAALGTYGWSTAIYPQTLLAAPDAPTALLGFPSSSNPSGRTGYHDPEFFEV